MEKPAMGIPIIIGTIFLFMTGYIWLVTSNTKVPEASTQPPATSIQTPAAPAQIQEPASGGSSSPAQQPAVPAGKELKSWTGRFAGNVDSSLVVIYVGDEAKTFLSSPGLGANLAKGDNISFEFYLDRNGQPVLSSIKKLSPSE